MTAGRLRLLGALVWVMLLLTGCASPLKTPRTDGSLSPQWQGRLSIQVQSTPVQILSAQFDLQGDAQIGNLTFSSPLGNTLAHLQWDKDSAVLQAQGETQQFTSLDALVHHVTGTDLPISSLFAWLQGVETDAPGWKADLSELANGRLNAHRLDPYTPAHLKIILDR